MLCPSRLLRYDGNDNGVLPFSFGSGGTAKSVNLTAKQGVHFPSASRMAYQYFEGKDHAAKYSKYRPSIPKSLVETAVQYLKEEFPGTPKLAVDIGCGPGQSTELFCPYFESVVGVDISKAQIEEALKKKTANNVSYKISGGESTPFSDNSVAFVSTINSLHWMDVDKFFSEMKRILVPSGVLFASLFRLRYIMEEGLKDALDELRNKEFNSYTIDRHKFWKEGYSSITFPFRDVISGEDTVTVEMPLPVLTETVKTWSVVNYVLEKEPQKLENVMNAFEEKIMTALGTSSRDTTKVKVGIQSSHILCRK